MNNEIQEEWYKLLKGSLAMCNVIDNDLIEYHMNVIEKYVDWRIGKECDGCDKEDCDDYDHEPIRDESRD